MAARKCSVTSSAAAMRRTTPSARRWSSVTAARSRPLRAGNTRLVACEDHDMGADVTARLRTGRRITGMSAVLLPYTADGAIDWANVEAHVARTHAAGLTPAVNMDTGYVQLLSPDERERVLD